MYYMNSNISNEFKIAVKKWVEIDNEQKKIRGVSSNLKKEKDKLQIYITHFMETNDMKNKNILINDGKIQYSTSKTTQPISKKYIIEKLTKYYNNSDKAEEIASLLYDNREIRYKSNLKRLKNKK